MPKSTGKYTEIDLEKAIEAVRTQKMSKKAAAKFYNVPRTTLIFRLSSKFVKSRPGPQTVLSAIEEECLEQWITTSQRKGFPKRKEDVLHAVKEFLDEDKREHPFGPQNIPGNGWFKAFLARHPSISLRTPDPVTSASATVGSSDIKSWFIIIETYLKEQNMLWILSDATRVFNEDETNFLLCPKTKTVLAAKGARCIYEVDRGFAKSNLTVMFSFSASGVLVPPMVIYPYKRIPEDIRKSLPKGWGLGISDNGWMTKEVFYEYISKVFHPHLVSIGTNFPVIFFVDGHATHLTLPVSKLCVQLGIILIALYPNATRILQPADVSAFKPLKNGWNKKVSEWRRQNSGDSLTRQKFAPLLDEVVLSSISPEIIQNGFRACGLFPWDMNAIDFSRCLGKSSKTQLIPVPAQEQNSANNKTISFKTFSEVVGTQKLEEFGNAFNGNGSNLFFTEEWKMLYKIFLKFKSDTITQQTTTTIQQQTIHDTNLEDNATKCFDFSGEIDINNIEEFIYDSETVPNEIPNNDPMLNNAICIGIDNYLDWPITPDRQGVKPMKPKKPFVITDDLWIKAEEIKKEAKIKEYLEKEERKTKRLENKSKKESTKKSLNKKVKFKKRPVKSGQNAAIKSGTTANIAVSASTQLPVKRNHQAKNNIDVQLDMPKKIHQSSSNSIISLKLSDNIETKCDTEPKETHVRNLFQNIENIGENKIAIGTICYECTYFLKNKMGIKCDKCIREMHISCIEKLNLPYLPIFICNKCINKN